MGRFATKLFGFTAPVIAVMVGAVALWSAQDRATPLPDGFIPVDIGAESPLWMARQAVQVEDWQACASAGACPALQGDSRTSSMVKVSVYDAAAYIAWKSHQDGVTYRLPRYEEWVLASADLAPPPKEKLFTAPEMAWAADYSLIKPDTRDLGENLFGLMGMRDMVWEWTSSCFDSDGQPGETCYGTQIAMGHHVAELSIFTRDTARIGCGGGYPPPFVGFRLVAEIG